MRRRLAAALLIIPAVLLTACSSSEKPPKTTKVAGKVGERPEIAFPTSAPPKKLTNKVIVAGHGPVVQYGDYVLAKLTAKVWNGKKYALDANAHDTGPELIKVGSSLGAINKGLPGKKAGSRVLLVAPPLDAFGPDGNEALGVGKSDTVVLVVDIYKVVPLDPKAGVKGVQKPTSAGMPQVTDGKSEPKITIPKGATTPKTVQSQVLIQGTGPVIKKGQTLVTQLTSVTYPAGKKMTSSWANGKPLTFRIGTGWIWEGVNQGLEGKHVGDRVLLVVPADLAFKSSAAVFVIDILDAA